MRWVHRVSPSRLYWRGVGEGGGGGWQNRAEPTKRCDTATMAVSSRV